MIYHYTTLDTLRHLLTLGDSLEILADKSPVEINILFHATGVRFLNDTKENQLLPAVFLELEVPQDKLFAIDGIKGLPYVLSFSLDDDNLTMWRNYANDGKGIALGFDEKMIADSLELHVDFMGECEYIAVEDLKEKMSTDPLFIMYKSDPENTAPLLSLYSKSLKYKHGAFAHEREYRITFSCHADEDFFVRGDAIATYQIVRIPFNALQTIIVGPCLDFEKTRFSISRMMYRYLEGFPNQCQRILPCIYKSEAPYNSR